MKSIYEELAERVYNGDRFNINFEKRNIKVGKTYLIKDGEYDTEQYELPKNITMQDIEYLYEEYKHSTPSERSENKRRVYFKALSLDDLTDEQLVLGEPRELAQCKLECMVLCAILNGDLTWQDSWGTFFYQGTDSDFILLKKWIVNK